MGNRLFNISITHDVFNAHNASCRHRSSRNVSRVKNKPLRQIQVRWRSPFPITACQLNKKREEFWETAPAFDGRQEIWNALRAAVDFLERNDLIMAQAIINSAEIILPTGTLCDCYDELGTRYQLPLYVLSKPSNLIVLEDVSSDSRSNNTETPYPPIPSGMALLTMSASLQPGSTSTVAYTRNTVPTHVPLSNSEQTNCQPSSPGAPSHIHPTSLTAWFLPFICCGQRLHSSFSRCSGRPACSGDSSTDSKVGEVGHNSPVLVANSATVLDSPNAVTGNSSLPTLLQPQSPLRLRLSTGEEHLLQLPDRMLTVLEAKRLLAEQTQWSTTRQRWFICGHLLPNRARLSDCRIPCGFVVQVIVHTPYEPESQWGQESLKNTACKTGPWNDTDGPP